MSQMLWGIGHPVDRIKEEEMLHQRTGWSNFQMIAPRHLLSGPAGKLFNSFLAIHAFP
jgi:hypothetical protein